MATREGRAAREFVTGAAAYECTFAALFQTSCRVENLEQSAGYYDADEADRPTSEYILKKLYEDGEIAYHKTLGVWLPFSASGRQNIYGVSETFRLYGSNGRNIPARRDDIVVFRANPQSNSIADIVRDRSALLADFDNAIKQNLDAVKEMTVIISQTRELADQIKRADAARRRGASVAVMNASTMEFNNLQTLKTEAEYKIDRLIEDKRKVYEDTLHLVNVRTPIEKGERMITGEINTQNEETDAYGNVLKTTFNGIAEHYGLPFRIAVNVAQNGEQAAKTGESESADYTDDISEEDEQEA